jgi:hypothetical protein
MNRRMAIKNQRLTPQKANRYNYIKILIIHDQN